MFVILYDIWLDHEEGRRWVRCNEPYCVHRFHGELDWIQDSNSTRNYTNLKKKNSMMMKTLKMMKMDLEVRRWSLGSEKKNIPSCGRHMRGFTTTTLWNLYRGTNSTYKGADEDGKNKKLEHIYKYPPPGIS
ncbi:unnamed protein product [Lactuca saligna]|uniref:Uncharacterized protein n=1 Tax=Lactuca saligna TaxID=75948 RepID=A0AA35YPK2_LACSI|nr:unnamed protein product [Lactuca saligna]